MNAYEAQIEKLAKEGLLPNEIERKLALFEYDIYLMTPHSWYMRASPEDLNSALLTALLRSLQKRKTSNPKAMPQDHAKIVASGLRQLP